MPQSPLSIISHGSMIFGQGISSALNVTAASVIKATPGRVVRITVLGVVGTAGALTVNDCATVATATAANEIFTLAFGSATPGTIITLDFPCQTGIVISAVPTGGTPLFAVSYV